MTAANSSPRVHTKSLGFSMVELMVALTVGLLLIGGMVATLVASSGTGKTRERSSEIQNSGRYALDLMKRDLQHAGFMGYTGRLDPSFDRPHLEFTVENQCDTAQWGQLTQRVWGAEKTTGKLQCISPGDIVKDTDVILVRHLGQTPVADGALKSGVMYFRTSYQGFKGFLGPTVPADYNTGWTPGANYAYQETIYYVSKFTTSKNENPAIPALWRVKMTDGPKMVPELVASGVEHMQVRYKERVALGKTPEESKYAWQPADRVADWSAVVAVEVSLLVRGSSAEQNLENVREFVLGDETVKVPADSIPRQVFTTVVYLRNS